MLPRKKNSVPTMKLSRPVRITDTDQNGFHFLGGGRYTWWFIRILLWKYEFTVVVSAFLGSCLRSSKNIVSFQNVGGEMFCTYARQRVFSYLVVISH